MRASHRISDFKSSITLQLNAEAQELKAQGHNVINLTAGQLPFSPDELFIEKLKSFCDETSSFHYCPVSGDKALIKQVLEWSSSQRSVDLSNHGALISSGGKHSLSTLFCGLINPGDEVILLAPYWISYAPQIELYGGVCRIVESDFDHQLTPSIEAIKSQITSKTKAIVVNSPSNPSGIVYSEVWMQSFSKLVKDNPHLTVISDEIYRELSYQGNAPVYFYQYDSSLLDQTIIISGISKILASTGLRIGWTIAPKQFIASLTKLQGQLASGPNTLVQKALVDYGLENITEFLTPIKSHLLSNLETIKDVFTTYGIGDRFYQTEGAFYFLINFSGLPVHQAYQQSLDDEADYSADISRQLLSEAGVAVVPSGDFGLKNAARISLVSHPAEFREAIEKIAKLITAKKIC